MSAFIRGSRKPRSVVALLLSGLLLFATAGTATGGGVGPRRTMLALTNRDRVARGRQALDFADRLARYAKAHSEAMARDGYLFHSSEDELRAALEGYDWSIGGENLGTGASLASLEDAFMTSQPHRENVLRRGFGHAAIGIVRDDGRIWITVIFYG